MGGLNGDAADDAPQAHRRISDAKFLPDRSALLTASEDNLVLRWDLPSSPPAAWPNSIPPRMDLILTHPAPVNALCLTRDGRQVLTGCNDGAARFWNLDDGTPAWSWRAATAAKINSVSISPANSLAIAVDSASNQIHLLDTELHCELPEPGADGDRVVFLDLRPRDALGWSATFTPDGTRLVTVGGDEARLWDLATGREVLTLNGHTREVTSVSFSRDGRYVLSSSRDGTATVWPALVDPSAPNRLDVADRSGTAH